MKNIIRKIKRNIVMCFLMACGCFVLASMEVNAAGTYNRDAVCNYGGEHYDDCDEKCAGFASLCVNQGGCDVFSRSCTELRRQLLASGMGTEYDLALQLDMSIRMSDYPDRLKVGDVVFYYCPGCVNLDGKPYIHAVICAGMDSDGYMRAYSTNNPNSGTYKYRYGRNCYYCGTAVSKAVVYHFEDANSPMGNVDEMSGGAGYIQLRGWTFDWDDVNASLELHIYVGGEAGSGAPCYVIPEVDQLREDVNDVYPGSGDYHGFNDVMYVNEVGEQPVYVYAINVGGGDNVLIGQRTVNIKPRFTIDFSADNVELGVGETVTVSMNFKGEGIYTLRYVIENNSCCKAKWTGGVNYTTGDTSINIIGVREGTSNVKIQLLDRNYESLYEETFKVTVTTGGKIFTASCDALEIGVGETESISLQWSGYPDLAYISYGYNTEDGNAKYISMSYKDLTWSGITFDFTGIAIGEEKMEVALLDQNRNILATKELYIVVK